MVTVTFVNADGTESVIAEQGREGFEILGCETTVALDTVSSGEIRIPATNKMRNVLRGRNPTIAIYEDQTRVFIGSCASPLTEDIYGNLKCSLDGALSWLGDITKPPFYVDASMNMSIEVYLSRIVTQYNAAARAERQIKFGGVTVSGLASASHSDEYCTMLDLIREVREKNGGYLLEAMGGRGDLPRIDYFDEPTIRNPYPLYFGENILSLNESLSFDEYASRICATGQNGLTYTAIDTDAERIWGRVDYPLRSNAETAEELKDEADALLAIMAKPFRAVTAEVVDKGKHYLPGQIATLIDRKTGLTVDLLVQSVTRNHMSGKKVVTCGREKIPDFTARGGAASPDIRQAKTDALAYETNVDAKTDAWHGFTTGWNVTKNEDIINMSKGEFEPDNSDNTKLLTWSKSAHGDFWFTPQLYRPLDMPLDHSHSAIDGTSDRLYWAVQSADFSHNVRATFRLGSSINPASTSSDAYPMNRPFIRLNVNGRRATPPSTPRITTVPATNLATVARTYLTAREGGTRAFAYGANWTYRSTAAVFTPTDQEDERPAGRGLMECDTLAFMCLIGMDYTHSPYAGNSATADFDTIMSAHFASGGAASAYGWTANTKQIAVPINGEWANGLGGRMVDQSGMGWWLWDNSFVFRPVDADGNLDLSQLKQGDIVMFRRVPCSMFDNLGHIGIIDIVDGEPYVIHVTIEGWTQGKVIVRSRLKDEFYQLKPGRYSLEDTYFARIDYGN